MLVELHLCVLEVDSTVEEADGTWETRVACGSGCRKDCWRGVKSCCPLPAASGMNSRLWSLLPSEVVEIILQRLPASSQARFQAVCKGWRSLLASPHFQRQSALVALIAGRGPCALVETSGRKPEAPADVLLRRSHKLKLDVLSRHEDDYHATWFDNYVFTGDREGATPDRRARGQPGSTYNYSRVWSQGLLCVYYEGCRPLGLHICVINPVNRTWAELPYLAATSSVDATSIKAPSIIVVPRSESHFRVMVLFCWSPGCPEVESLEFWLLSIFCTKTGAWSTTSTSTGCDTLLSKVSNRFPHLVVGELVYVVLGPDHLMVLSAENGEVVARLTGVGRGGWGAWAYRVPLEVPLEALVEHHGDVYCVALSSNACSIWKLDGIITLHGELPKWAHTSSFNWVWTAAHAAREGDLDSQDLFSCVAANDHIHVSAEIFPHGDVLVSYNIRDGQWQINNCYAKVLLAPRPNLYLSRLIS